MRGPPVLVDASAPAWHVMLNRPERGNACSVELIRGLDDVIERAETEGAHAVVLQGEGRHFCTGFDLSSLDGETDDTLLARFVRIELLLQRIANAPFLTVAVAQGRTTGAGADLFAACDVRLALANAAFAFPGARGFGLVLGTRRLAARVGTVTALDWVDSGRVVTVQDALRSGFVLSIVEGPRDSEAHVRAHLHPEGLQRANLRKAVDPHGDEHSARDLDLLVRSAAPPGLRHRLAEYASRVAAARAEVPTPPSLPRK